MPDKEIELSLDLPAAPNIEVIEEKRPAMPLSQNLPQAPDIEIIEEKRPVAPLSTQLPQAPDMESIIEELRSAIISTNVPVSSDKQVIAQIVPPPLLSTQLLQAPDMESIQELPRPILSLDLAPAPSMEMKNVFIPFDGEWMPDSDPIEIGARNYKTLQNYRYAGDKIVHLESVLGYTKINSSNALPTNYKTIRNGYQLRSEFTQKTYVLVHSSYAGNPGIIYQNQTTIPSVGDFVGGASATPLHTDSANDLEGRFSDAPNGQVAYCNTEESCIWAGEEMRCAGFFTFFSAKIVAATIAFIDGGGSADTITDTGEGFISAGFKAGHTITISGAANVGNNVDFVIVSVTNDPGVKDIITLATAAVTAEGASNTITIEVSVKKDHISTKDYTEAINNEINSEAESATVDGGTVGNRWVVLSTRPLKAVKYYIRTVNDTGSASTTCKVWDGDSFKLITNESDGTDSSGSMKQTGTYSFDSTAYVAATITATITFANANPDTIAGTGLAAAGFLAGMTIEVSGSGSNDGTYTIDTVAASLLTLVSGDELSVEGPTASVTITSILTAKPIHFEGLFVYAYLFELSAGIADIYHVTVDAPFQNIVDVWDGVYRQPIQCQVATGYQTASTPIAGSANLVAAQGFFPAYAIVPTADWPDIQVGASIVANGITQTVLAKVRYASTYYIEVDAYMHNIWYNGGTGYSYTYANPEDAGTAGYKDFTLEVNEPSFADYPIGAVIDGLTSLDHILLCFEERISAIYLEMIADLVNTNSVQISVGYWNGETYVNQLGKADSTYGLPGNAGANKSCNRSGLVSWDSPDEEDEFRQTLFGVNGYYYQITFDGTLSGTKGGAAEVVIDTIKGIPVQKTVNPFKFSVSYKNRLMLCGFTKGKEGNRIDYSVKDAPDVFNGEESSMDGIQSLYIGGREDLTGAIEIFNRFGSSIISSLLFFKDTETYLLTGDGPDNYRIYTISKTIGCPAPLTLAAAETGYTFAEEINRNIVKWMSYSGPMIFDGSAIVPITGVKKYFDPAKTATTLLVSIIERCRGWYDATYKEYNLVIPSGTGATSSDLWIFYDLVKKRWSEKEPGASEIPQAAWPVYDTDGKQYIYAGIDDGNVMRLENGNTWADDSATGMAQVIETGDFFPSGNLWDITVLRRIKTAVKKIAEASKNLAITWYKDTEASGTSLTAHDLDAGDPISKSTQNAPSATPLRGWCHRFLFSVTTSSTAQLTPVGFGFTFFVEREDERDL